MNLVWLDINSSYSHSSLALPSIEACRGGDPYQWLRVSGTINSDPYLLTKQLYCANPTIIAATLWLYNHQIVVAICERIKVLLPDVVILLGGPEFNGTNEEFLRRHREINMVFRGEGELAFHQIINGDDPTSIEGLCYIDQRGEYCDNGVARVANFESIPTPEESEFFPFDSPFVQIETSRGCFNSCAFCVSGGDRPIRSRSIEDVKRRVERVRSHGVRDVRLLDRTFNYSVRRARELLQLFTQYPDMNFHLEIHPALLTDELCDELASMPKGLLHLEAGMQSLDERVIDACERIGDCRSAIEGLRRLCEMTNFETHADLIAGLPHYTIEQIFCDIRSLSTIGAGEIQLELLKLLPGTKMRREADRWGIKYSPSTPYEVLESSSISILELDRVRVLSKLLDRFYNAKGWRHIIRRLINCSEQFLPTFLDFLISHDILENPISLEKRGSLLYHFCIGWEGGEYLDDVSIAWIENGLSMRRPEAGKITKATTLPEQITRQPNHHYYLWQGVKGSAIFCFDRSIDHSHPISRVDIK